MSSIAFIKEVSEQLFGRELSDLEWEFAQAKPKLFLQKLLESKGRAIALIDL